MRNLKVALSVLLVLAVAFLVTRSCVSKRPAVRRPAQRVSVLPAKKAVPRVRATMAIILDDWGNSARLMKIVDEIKRPMTLSILPHLPFSRKIAEGASAKGWGVMLHLPMEPLDGREPLEPRTILTTMSDSEIRQILSSALESVPSAQGVNNHQGSAATSDPRVMNIVLGELKKRGLFFVDSRVTPSTVGVRLAGKFGLRFAARDVFIDNEMRAEAIRRQLERAKKIALARGSVIVIGHDKELTLRTIQSVVAEFERAGIRFVLVDALLS